LTVNSHRTSSNVPAVSTGMERTAALNSAYAKLGVRCCTGFLLTIPSSIVRELEPRWSGWLYNRRGGAWPSLGHPLFLISPVAMHRVLFLSSRRARPPLRGDPLRPCPGWVSRRPRWPASMKLNTIDVGVQLTAAWVIGGVALVLFGLFLGWPMAFRHDDRAV